jgi:hypothetical protein
MYHEKTNRKDMQYHTERKIHSKTTNGRRNSAQKTND